MANSKQRQARAVFHITPLHTQDSQVPTKLTLYTNIPIAITAHFKMYC
jgi:hypothetical protein